MPRPLIMAHRGDSAHHLENTMPAFVSAVEKRADWIELDVRLSRDHRAVVFHDEDLQRLGGRPDLVRDLTADELAASPVAVPTLAEVLGRVGAAVSVYVEMKADATRGDDEGSRILLERCLELVPADSRHALGGFDPFMVRGVLAAGRRAVLGVSLAGDLELLEPSELERLFACCVQWGALDGELEAGVRALGAQLWVWTVDGEAAIDRSLSSGVDAICTNDVEATRGILAMRC